MTEGLKIQIDYLYSIGADKLPHCKKTLLEHLIGTSDILNHFGRSVVEQKAGLFHSIYGTAYYRHSKQLFVEREEVQDIIGIEAEVLVNIFCQKKDRTNDIINNTVLPDPWITQLRWIEFANLLEQKNPMMSDISPTVLINDFDLSSENVNKLGVLLNVI